MPHINASVQYFYYNSSVKAATDLSELMLNEMSQDGLTGGVFIFIGKRGDKIDLLQWGTNGFALYEKQIILPTKKVATDDDNFYL